MKLIVACSPSTGSSLLCQILNRHPDIYCGPESNLFIYPELYYDWERKKRKINSDLPAIISGFKDMRFYVQPKLSLDFAALNLDKRILAEYHSLETFAEMYFNTMAAMKGKIHWVEKTPANAFCFPLMKKYFKAPQLAGIVRNPYDTIYSMLRRGMSLYWATASYLLANAHILSLDNVNIISYEELVQSPVEVMTDFLAVYELDYIEDMVNVDADNSEEIQMEGWTYAENSSIGQAAVNKFYEAPPEIQAQIIAAIHSFAIAEEYRIENTLKYSTIPEIMKALQYPPTEIQADVNKAEFRSRIRKEQRQYLFSRMKAGIFSYNTRYPVRIEGIS